ncbi:class I SAM-dependent methyltransferase [Streptomyces sp. NPDC002172]
MYLLSSRSPAHPMSAPSGEAYAVSAEFYDVLQGEADAAHVRQLYGEAVGNARVAVLDIGTGTGRVTPLGLAGADVSVHALEPARSMRAALMTRLASLARRRARTGHRPPCTLPETGLRGVAGVAVCHNTLACLDPSSRRRLHPAVAEALCSGGVFLLQLSLARLPRLRTVHPLPAQTLGRHEYGGRHGAVGRRRPPPNPFRLLGAGRDRCAARVHRDLLDVVGFPGRHRRGAGPARITPVPDAGDPAALTVRRE